MRQTTEHQSYAGLVGVSSSHGLSPAFHSPDHRSGFTVIEVVVALAIFSIVVFALVSSYYGYYGNVQAERYKTVGENLAQLQLEDLQGTSVGVLQQIVGEGETGGYGYYPDRPTNPSTPSIPNPMDNYGDVSSASSVFDSGVVSGDFRIYKLTDLGNPSLSSASVPGIGVETVSGSGTSTYNVVLYADIYPGYTKQIVITDKTPGVTALTNKLFKIAVTVYWHSNGQPQQVTVTGFKNDLGSQ
ncbi:MAG TPA: prepilin-type N-terminal cleavage/methylation domain-containing protein [Candidatus Cryosericum sp.]